MNRFFIFILRVILAMAFSVVLTRLFHPERNLIFIAGIGLLLVLLAYIFEYFRNNSANRHGE